ncbi:VOC family protein [Thalassobaculum sp.]|uniref:VOC family protein n=1 Tax=Thalassobaculum sp. TaxID=2022740 RepID=UPI0032ED863A
MRLTDLYPIVMTDQLSACRRFWVEQIGFSVVFEASWIVVLASAGEQRMIAFMTPDHPSTPPGRECFDATGLLLTLEVDDVDAEHARLSAAGLAIEHGPVDEAWGQRRFLARDPAGIWVDVVKQIAPAEGFWERYTAA